MSYSRSLIEVPLYPLINVRKIRAAMALQLLPPTPRAILGRGGMDTPNLECFLAPNVAQDTDVPVS
jgi:hypothetical protein